MKLTGIGKEILRKKIKEHCGRETYNKYSAASPARSAPPLPAHLANTRARSVDYSNWKQVLFKFEEIILPALEAEGARGIAEAKRAHLPLCLCACLSASSEVASACVRSPLRLAAADRADLQQAPLRPHPPGLPPREGDVLAVLPHRRASRRR